MAQQSKRVYIDDDEGEATGRWFDPSTAQQWEEATRWDGSNHVSIATGSQWAHETLYLTKGGKWVLFRSSQWQGTRDSYSMVTASEACAWLLRCEHDPPEVLAPYLAESEV